MMEQKKKKNKQKEISWENIGKKLSFGKLWFRDAGPHDRLVAALSSKVKEIILSSTVYNLKLSGPVVHLN